MINYYIGLDIGTSSVKAMLISEDSIIKTVSLDYPIRYPKPGYSEQDPHDWFNKSIAAVRSLTEDVDKSLVRSIAFSGQMHGLVLLDEIDEVIRPAILWNDGRSEKEVAYLNEMIGKDFLLSNTGNIAFAGFTAPKLLWVRENEPENFKRIRKIMLPKDYVAYRFSGAFATDPSDAAGTLYFDVKNRRWSKPMLKLLQVEESRLPQIFESSAAIGCIKPEIAAKLGLSADVKIVIGAGDNAASAIGTGTINSGDCNISLGTSGTVFVCADTFGFDRENAIHSFCSANGMYHYLACTLTAAACQKWWVEDILRSDYASESNMEQFIGNSSVLFLPYLMGERSPVNDTNVRGLFAGLSMTTAREEMTLAVLEGVAFSLKQNVEVIRSLGVDIKRSKICGGGAKNRLWCRLLATVLGIELEVPVLEHGGVLGACLLAAMGDGNDIAHNFYGVKETISPDEMYADYYAQKYQKYLSLYPAVSHLNSATL
ncbi:MAG TPA: xylulokinase [Candidatus Fimivicinus intestinavium]|nr:xylulokinase [Candidatus Fimivicinus intestinavium]